MSSTSWHFPIFVAAAIAAFWSVLHFTLCARVTPPSHRAFFTLSLIVVVGGVLVARHGAASGWPAWLHFGLPAALTWVLPPVAFSMRGRGVARYVPLALLIAPAIHLAFSLLLGWGE